MSSAAWEEVKRLAADFQRAQLTSTVQRLSERNCIELVNKLVELKLLNIHHTVNGKEYITPSHLLKEIKDELYYHGGRLNLVDLAEILSIDFNIIEAKVKDLVNSDDSYKLIVGNLVSSHYLNTIAEEINETLQQEGSLALADIAKNYDFPGEFVYKLIENNLGSVIYGKIDANSETLFTELYVAKHKAKLLGILSAITRPTSVSSLIMQHNLSEKLFFHTAETIISSGKVLGSLSGGRFVAQAVYIPSIYSQTQKEWITNFFQQNGYLEYDTLKKLGIIEPVLYMKRMFNQENLVFLDELCIGSFVISQIEAALEDILLSGSFLDCYPLLPSIMNELSSKQLIQHLLDKFKEQIKAASEAHIMCDLIVVTNQLLKKVSVVLEALVPHLSKEVVEKGLLSALASGDKIKDDGKEESSKKNKREDRQKKASMGKSGGGTQGRETKTKSVKRKLRVKKVATQEAELDDEDEEDLNEVVGPQKIVREVLSIEEMETEIVKLPELVDAPEELVKEISKLMSKSLSIKVFEAAHTIMLASLASQGSERKKTHQHLQDKVLGLINTVRLSEKGIKEFTGEIQSQLYKYTLKTQCTEITNELVLYLVEDAGKISANELSSEQRQKMLNHLPNDARTAMVSLHKTLNSSNLEEFYLCLDEALNVADIFLKKKDNKKDRQILHQHMTNLIEQLGGCIDSALTLHLGSLILFQASTGNMLHASGKFVPHIISFLKSYIQDEDYNLLQEYQSLVIKSISHKVSDADSVAEVAAKLETLTPDLKRLASSFKKRALSES